MNIPPDKINLFTNSLNEIYSYNDPNLTYNILSNQIIKHFIKLPKQICISKKENPWITIGIKTSIKIRNKLFRKKQNLTLAKYYKSKLSHYCNILRENYFKEQIYYSSDTKQQWNLLAEFLKTNHKKCNYKGNINEMNKFFATIGSELASKIPESKIKFNYKSHVNSMFLSEITEEEIFNKIKLLKLDKAKGSDNISIKLIKNISHIIVKPLAYIFNLCFQKGIVPDKFKIATIAPIYKNEGPLNNPSQFRPISLLPITAKLFEQCIYERLYSYLEKNNILSSKQYGFRINKNTEEAINSLVNKINLKQNNLVVFLDLKKAFDTVDHNIMLSKLETYGIRGNVLNLFKSYLNNRYCNTKIGNLTSELDKITCGVPQGSCLGPLLFILYINSITELKLHGELTLFADDTCLFLKAKNNQELYIKTNSDLYTIQNWLNANKLSLNVQKTEFIDFSPVINTNYSIQINNNIIKRVESYKYLGCIINKHLDFSQQIESTERLIKKSCKALNVCINPIFKKSVFSAFVMSFLNYALSTWGSKNVYNLQKTQEYLIKKYNITNVLSLNDLYIHKRIQLVRKNKLDLSSLSYKEISLYNNYNHLSDISFKQEFLGLYSTDDNSLITTGYRN